MTDPAETEEDGPETEPDSVKSRALSAARAGATDAEVIDVLRADCGLGKRDAERRVKRWAKKGLLEATRTAGRLLPIEKLQDAAKAGDASAAAHLARREAGDVSADLKRLLASVAGMAPAERAAYLLQLAERLGAG